MADALARYTYRIIDREMLLMKKEETAADPCESLECGPWSRCQVSGGAATCRCLSCPPPPAPGSRSGSGSHVCGSDGRDYGSECELHAAACRLGDTQLALRHHGKCDPCRGVVCAEPGAVCRAGVCACRDDCPRDAPAERVCGSDGRTYRSECRLHLASCRRPRGRSPITVAFYGDCRAADEETAVVALTSTTAFSVSPTPLSTLPGDYDADGVQKVSKSTRHLALAEAVAGAAGAVSHQQYLLPDAGAGLTSASLYRGLSDHPDTESLYSAVYRPTPATLSSLLGGACSTDGDCSVADSRCQENTCRCGADRTPSHDRRHCLVYQVPSFDGQAYIEMKRLKAHNKLNIEIEFITYANDGLLLYNQQKEDGTGDFVSLAIVQGHVEFRYNLGNGAVRLTSAERVTLGRVHVARARRYHRDGLLRLDDGPEVVGQSQGPLRALNLELSAYLGAVPTNHSRVFENVGTARGLVGCVRRLRLGQQTVVLEEGGALVLRSSGVRQCGRSPCAHLPCQNAATCSPTGDDTFHCDCPPQFTGPYCESKTNSCAWSPCVAGSWCEVSPEGGFTCNCGPTSIKLPCYDFDAENQEAFVPEFDGNSFIELPRLEGVGKAFAMELWFLTRAVDGVLLYSGQRLDGKGDYIALVLVSGYVQFHFELGSGPGKTVTTNRITLNQWHSVKVSYMDREGTLQLDDGPTATGMSGAPLNELNLDLPLYIGGLPATMYTGVIPLPNLVGAVQRLVVNGQILENLGEGVASVSRWSGPPCTAHTCLHGGACQPRLNSFLCRCPARFRGPRCQYVDTEGATDSTPVKFTGNTYVKLSLAADTSINGSMKHLVNETFVYSDNQGGNERNLEITGNDIYEHSDYYEEDKDDDESDIGGNHFIEGDTSFSPEKQADFKNLAYRSLPVGEINGRFFHYEVTFHTMEASGLLLWNDRKIRHRSNYVALAISDGYLELRYRLGKTKYSASLQSKVYVSDGGIHTVVAEIHWKYSFLQVDDEHPKQKFTKGNNIRRSLAQDIWIGGMGSLPSGLPTAYYSGFLGCMHRLVAQKELIDLQSGEASNITLSQCTENEE
ncbi:agrin-like [Schistocerca piceifrons]|uniref:agrin-like n=1 Tax=Schistocerca piceifrons TaxID=274613 RepID=UPI001F5EF9A9|nr:agrin-like [Schistocerca piceifrons]